MNKYLKAMFQRDQLIEDYKKISEDLADTRERLYELTKGFNVLCREYDKTNKALYKACEEICKLCNGEVIKDVVEKNKENLLKEVSNEL